MQIELEASKCRLVATDGVKASLHQEMHRGQKALRLDFQFSGSGYALLRIPVNIRLHPNYVFQFQVAGQCPDNTLEFKLLDASTDNVWWVNRPNFKFTKTFQTVVNKKRHLSYAWGPVKEPLQEVAFLDLTITNANGGQGSVIFKGLTYEELPLGSASRQAPEVWASSNRKNAQRVLDEDPYTRWESQGKGELESLIFRFREGQELSALVLEWGEHPVQDFQIDIKEGNGPWRCTDTIRGATAMRQYLLLPDCDISAVRLTMRKQAAINLPLCAPRQVSLRSVTFHDRSYAPCHNSLWKRIAKTFPRGYFPRYHQDEQSFWTVVGASGSRQEAIINEEGMLEVGRQTFSLEPFLFNDRRLLTWACGDHNQSLADGYLPIAQVERRHNQTLYQDVRGEDEGPVLKITAFAQGGQEDSTLYARYTIKNESERTIQRGRFYLALRQFQVNPPWQFLNTPGGFTAIHSLERSGKEVLVNGRLKVVELTPADGFGATTIATDDVVEHLNYGLLPEAAAVYDERGFASGALMWHYEIQPGEEKHFDIAVPYTDRSQVLHLERALEETRSYWLRQLEKVQVEITAAPDLVRTIKSQLAYILINRDGDAIQPGSRCYRRTWIRDGSLTSAALLQNGFEKEVRAFIEWFAPYQYENGKIPCCVDKRGSDPVPEHDSHGEFIYLVMEYYRFTRDLDFLRALFPRLLKAVAYIQELRSQCLTEDFQAGGNRAHLYGILPPSISHEGYSAHPAYSNWDNLFAMKGLDDAAQAAAILGENEEAERLRSLAEEFRHCLLASIQASMSLHGIDYIPGANDLGDFDATSTTIGLDPANTLLELPKALEATFERYIEFFRARRDGKPFVDYTPYELRTVGTFVRLSQADRAHEALDYFMQDRRPAGWNHWAEVVYKNPLTPRFIGDAPHGWVGSDFLRSVRNLFVYETAESLVVGAGIKPQWLEQGVKVVNLPTHFGPLTFSARRQTVEGKTMTNYEVDGPITAPVELHVLVGGKTGASKTLKVTLSQLPCRVQISCP